MEYSKEIQHYEEQLKEAMLQSDISMLDKLLADNLLFTNHLGHIMTKQDDIDAHRSKILKINEITFSDQKINTYENIAIVTVKARIKGIFNGEASENSFRFTRVWRQNSNTTWQVISAHSCIAT